MALGERFKGGGAHGVARFLAEHQHCDSGFEVHRDPGLGSGQLSITCEGCGARVDYRAAEAAELAAGSTVVGENGEPRVSTVPPPQMEAHRQQPAAPLAGPPPATPPAAAPRRMTPGAFEPARPRRRGFLPTWVPVGLIAGLIVGGLAMIVIGLSRDNEQPAPTPQAGQGQGAQPAPPAAGGGSGSGAGQQGGNNAPTQGGNNAPAPSAGGEAPAEGAGDVPLQRRTFAERFAIGVPKGWENGVEDGGITLSGPGATAEIVAFFEQGATPATQLARSASRFLAQRHPGAQVSQPTPVRLGAYRGLRVTATYQGGEEVAVVVSAKGFSHLVLRRVDRGASPDLERQADAALASYRPK